MFRPLRRPKLDRKLFFIHVMKTAGTSFRRMLISSLGAPQRVYPNDRDLARLPNGFYPSPEELLRTRAGVRSFDVLVGHYPAIMGERFFGSDFRSVVFLREPVARTLSMIVHRIERWPGSAGLSPHEVLDDATFVRNQIADYQTKIFAFDSIAECGGSVNQPLAIGPARYDRALERLERVDVVGLTECFEASLRMVEARTGLRFGAPVRTNCGRRQPKLLSCDEALVERIRALVPNDLRFYQAANRIFQRQLAAVSAASSPSERLPLAASTESLR
jgi:hypothetical protein